MHKQDRVREQRIEVARRIAKLLILQGYVVICPVICTHNMKLPTNWQFWKKYDLAFLKWCDEFWVIMLPGWKESDGTQSEIKLAKLLNKKIVYLEPDHE
jgi:hypothetical protein